MKCIILAAGYATRLYPLTLNKPKPLLEVNGQPVLEHILAKVEKVKCIDEIYIITNNRFHTHFIDWLSGYDYGKKITILNDGSTTNENRLGAIADIQYVIDNAKVEDDIMVLAGDNLFDYELTDFVEYFTKTGKDLITTHVIEDKERLKRTGVIEIDNSGKVLSFEEKPQNPKSNLAVPPFYIYKKETLSLFTIYLQEGNNPDAPGNFIPWLINRKDVYTFKFKGDRYDIGSFYEPNIKK